MIRILAVLAALFVAAPAIAQPLPAYMAAWSAALDQNGTLEREVLPLIELAEGRSWAASARDYAMLDGRNSPLLAEIERSAKPTCCSTGAA